jgi:hypothetical protein
MADNSESRPNFRRLRIIQIASLMVGTGVLILSLWLMGQFRKPEVAPIVMAFAFASISFSGLFYFGALLLEGSLQKYILSDDTIIKGDNVEMVTRTAESGDAEIDKWIGTYAFTRNLFGMSLVPILILVALYFFA